MRQRSLYLMPPAVLAAWGTVFLVLALSGKLRVLLNPLFWPLEIACGLMLLALALAYLILFRPVARESPSPTRFPVAQACVLVLPLLVAATLAPSSFSAAALEARAGLSGGKLLAQSGSGSSDAVELVDLAAAGYYPENIPKVSGKEVTYLGQYLPSQKPGEFRFLRVLMSCCAADATPIYLHVAGEPPQVSELSWITIEGRTFFRQEDGEWVPCVQLSQVSPAQAPPDPYLYAVRMKKP